VLEVNTAHLALKTADPKKPAWTASPFKEIAAVALGKNAALVAGVTRDKQGAVTAAGIAAVQLTDGKVLWTEPLPAAPVAWGVALDRDGRIVVTMTDGRVAAFEQR
jgi:hypothetical protein